MSTARDWLRQADAVRSRGEELRKFSELAEPGVRLGVKCGTFEIHDRTNLRVLIDAARSAADRLFAEADEIEARVQVVEP